MCLDKTCMGVGDIVCVSGQEVSGDWSILFE